MQGSKRYRANQGLVTGQRAYALQDAIDLLKQCRSAKFNESIDVSIKLGVDPKKADQQVRGMVILPHGLGKKVRIVVLAKGNQAAAATQAGADYVGDQDLVEQISAGWTDFDALIATPDMMREVGKLGKILGPRGLMPSPKGGTVTNDVAKAIQEIQAGKIEFKVDKNAMINSAVGKKTFSTEALIDNIRVVLQALFRAKPVGARGNYFISMSVALTMGPGVRIESKEFPIA